MSTTTKAERNAVEFGHHVGAPGWYNGLLVACSVEPGAVVLQHKDQKLSLRAFSAKSGQSFAAVTAYLTAWNAAAADGYVEPSETLTPADGIEGFDFDPDVATEALWLEYFDAAIGPRRETYREYNEQRRKPTKKQVEAAIKNDPAVAIVAREALAERDAKYAVDRAKRDNQSPSGADAPVGEMVAVNITARKVKADMHELLSQVAAMQAAIDTKTRDQVVAVIADLQNYLEAIYQVAQGGSMDDELAELLESGIE